MGGLPSGTVTFLFTDIEDSSAQWQADPEGMWARLRRHDEIIRGAVSDAGGVVFKHLGDGFGAAFDSASDALRAARAAQEALRAASWPGGDALRVRMGLHTGDAVPADGD